MANLFSFVPATTSSAKIDKGPRPWDVYRVEIEGKENDAKAVERAQAKAFASFLRVERVGEREAMALYHGAMRYTAEHKGTVVTKTGKEVEIIEGLNGYKRPMGAIRAMLEGKPVQDAGGLMLHVADMVWGAKAETYEAFFAAYRRSLDGPAPDAESAALPAPENQ